MPVRCGILIIGSLLWDPMKSRSDWRDSRLKMDEKISVSAPIQYGRRSKTRGDTYTMVFRDDDKKGTAVLVPCKNDIDGIAGLWEEAIQLWSAEQPGASKRIGSHTKNSPWGCVGALFRNEDGLDDLKKKWTEEFRKSCTANVSLVSKDGILGIPSWPKEATGDELTEVDVILATANKPCVPPPSAEKVAEAWLDKGSEEYFFNNVKCGIRTVEDGEIWDRMRASWLRQYPEAIRILQQERGKGAA